MVAVLVPYRGTLLVRMPPYPYERRRAIGRGLL